MKAYSVSSDRVPYAFPPGFSLGTAYRCALAAEAAYDRETIYSVLTDTQLTIDDYGQVIIVAFRGTKGWRDFVTDAKCKRVDYGAHPATVHRGFFEAHASVINKVVEHLERLPDKPVIVTGHSMGGALAVLCAITLSQWRTRHVHSVYTFGQPRTGDAGFTEFYNADLGDRTWRFVYEEDVVPRIPAWLMGYRHVGHEVFIPAFSRFLCPQGFIMDPPLLVKVASDALGLHHPLWRLAALFNLVGDHPADRDG